MEIFPLAAANSHLRGTRETIAREQVVCLPRRAGSRGQGCAGHLLRGTDPHARGAGQARGSRPGPRCCRCTAGSPTAVGASRSDPRSTSRPESGTGATQALADRFEGQHRRPPRGLAHAPALWLDDCPSPVVPAWSRDEDRNGLPVLLRRTGRCAAHVVELAQVLNRARKQGERAGAPRRRETDCRTSSSRRPAARSPFHYNGSVARLTFGPVSYALGAAVGSPTTTSTSLHIHEPNAPSRSMLAMKIAEGPIVATVPHLDPRSRWC